jgi:hypothetical protein
MVQAQDAKVDLDYTCSDLLMRVSTEIGEMLLLKHWEHLQHSVYFLQSAVFLATARLLVLARDAIPKLAEPKKVFEHMSMRFGIRLQGHPGITRRSQLDALLSYRDLMDGHDVERLWDLCNLRGWYEIRRQELDPILRRHKGDILYVDEGRTFAGLDEMATVNGPNMIDYWLERYAEIGVSKPEIVALLGRWLSARKTFSALVLVSQGLIEIGQRSDLTLLDVDIAADFALVESLKADTRYAVHRKTLQ